jgi:hypothetical protein
VLLADERFEVFRAVFAGEDLIGHAVILPQMDAVADFPRSGPAPVAARTMQRPQPGSSVTSMQGGN